GVLAYGRVLRGDRLADGVDQLIPGVDLFGGPRAGDDPQDIGERRQNRIREPVRWRILERHLLRLVGAQNLRIERQRMRILELDSRALELLNKLGSEPLLHLLKVELHAI